ncbi:Macrophage mannose receptor 1 [Temnothorax longispinosus]|uniref:Macrophage mannose receptor 1 n=1 Tax=Temnothorax longispinosus TaxID=300112 RepID=A0A4S2JF06_9HYME|nr:Macrophage mannose receptor 1 [Temnothorax longispinosus]
MQNARYISRSASTVLRTYSITYCDHCCLINRHELPQYDLIMNNSCSSQPIISRRIVSNVSECAKFAASKKALAFNFISSRNRTGGRENSCQALQCPEDYNMTTLVATPNCNYYSMYHILSPPVNATMECIPKAGMFMLSSESLNYTEARSFCQTQNASLAHIISEERTEGLGKFVSHNLTRFVGLSSENKERIWKNEFGESLSCFDYRAWGEGEPSYSKGCVALTKLPAKNSLPFWKVIPCRASLPFICELSPLSPEESSKQRHKTHKNHRRT